MRILVTGSREWDDRSLFLDQMFDLMSCYATPGHSDGKLSQFVIVHGACPTGLDAMADEWAVTNHVRVERHPADWEKHGNWAGPKRSQEMVDAGADVCLAFAKRGMANKGTMHCLRMAIEADIPEIRLVLSRSIAPE